MTRCPVDVSTVHNQIHNGNSCSNRDLAHLHANTRIQAAADDDEGQPTLWSDMEGAMPPLGMRLSKQWGCTDKDLPDWYGPVFMATVFGPILVGIAIATAPVWGIAAMTFLASSPTITAHAFWEVVKAIARKKNPVKAGAKAGLNASAVALIENWVKKFLSSCSRYGYLLPSNEEFIASASQRLPAFAKPPSKFYDQFLNDPPGSCVL